MPRRRQADESQQPIFLRKKIKSERPNQIAYIRSIRKNDITMCYGPAGTGKAQPLDALIKIPGGWKPMGAIQSGDTISAVDGTTTTVIGVYPQGEMEVFRIYFADGATAECSGDHLWKVWCSYEWRVVTTHEILRMLLLPSYRNRLAIPLPNPIQEPEVYLPLDPYLLGVLLGDGCLRNGVVFSSADDEILTRVRTIVEKSGCEVGKRNGKYDYAITGQGGIILQTLRDIGLYKKMSHEKFIPDVYLRAPVSKRLELVRGLMDTDGTTDKNGNINFSTASLSLAMQLQYLIRSLGGLCRMASKRTFYVDQLGKRVECRNSYRLNIRFVDGRQLFHLSRKKSRCESYQYRDSLRRRIVGIEYIGRKKCQCISVSDESSLYLTNDFVVTHNTYMACGIAADLLLNNKIQKIILTRPAVECGEKLGSLPGELGDKLGPYLIPLFDSLGDFLSKKEIADYQNNGQIEICPLAYMRGRTLKDAFVILDEAENCKYTQLKMFLTRFGHGSKMVINGDITQSDLPDANRVTNPFEKVIENLQDIDGIGIVRMSEEDIMRPGIVREIVRRL